jgi:hypothetical protein
MAISSSMYVSSFPEQRLDKPLGEGPTSWGIQAGSVKLIPATDAYVMKPK